LVHTGHNGWLVPADQEAHYIAAALDIVRDPMRIMAMREATRQSVVELDWLQIVLRVERIFLQALAAPRLPT